jgi:Thioredoxin
MKPDWDKLAESFMDSKTQLIADVDCTAEGEPLCRQHGVQGYPTIKYGDPSDLQDYEGGRDYESLKAFADENLKPQCSPVNLDLCDDEKKAEIKKYQDMGKEALEAAIDEKEDQLADIEEAFEKFVEGLQKSYMERQEQDTLAKEAIKNSGLKLMKAVRASLAAEKKGSDEL